MAPARMWPRLLSLAKWCERWGVGRWNSRHARRNDLGVILWDEPTERDAKGGKRG
jgi:hypothetical protein